MRAARTIEHAAGSCHHCHYRPQEGLKACKKSSEDASLPGPPGALLRVCSSSLRCEAAVDRGHGVRTIYKH